MVATRKGLPNGESEMRRFRALIILAPLGLSAGCAGQGTVSGAAGPVAATSLTVYAKVR